MVILDIDARASAATPSSRSMNVAGRWQPTPLAPRPPTTSEDALALVWAVLRAHSEQRPTVSRVEV